MDFFILIVGLALLVFGAEGIIRGSVSLAKQLQVSLFAIGVVVVAAGTSLPELANCIRTVIINHPDIAVGAVVGSNIANVILIMGTTALLCPVLSVTGNQVNQSLFNILISLGFIIFCWMSLEFNSFFGFISLTLLIIIMSYQIRVGQVNLSEVEEQKTYSLFLTILFIVVGILLLILGSRLFIQSAIIIAQKFQIPESVIGVSLVAFGTSLPELVVGVVSAIRRRVDFALGNILGSNIYNILGILGISSFFGDFNVPDLIANYDMYVMIGTVVFLFIFMTVFKKLNRIFGILSLVAYTAYIYTLYG
jgi:cation:H+ antiporter